jgi:hypothetical protein
VRRPRGYTRRDATARGGRRIGGQRCGASTIATGGRIDVNPGGTTTVNAAGEDWGNSPAPWISVVSRVGSGSA